MLQEEDDDDMQLVELSKQRRKRQAKQAWRAFCVLRSHIQELDANFTRHPHPQRGALALADQGFQGGTLSKTEINGF